MDIQLPDTPYLALGSVSGCLFSRVIEFKSTVEFLIHFMNEEAGAEVEDILIIKNDEVIAEIIPNE